MSSATSSSATSSHADRLERAQIPATDVSSPAIALRTLTLGCRVNQYETELLRQALVRGGFRDALDGEPAGLCVVNTCTVTHEADAKSRQAIRRLAKENPAAKIVVMGCYATRAPEELAALPQVAEVVTDKRELPDALLRWGVRDPLDSIDWFPGRRRAYVKVQDGCLLRCTFCIIPHVRPPMHSRAADSIEREVRALVDHGHREIVLVGIHLGHYGVDRNAGLPKAHWMRLAHLVERLSQLPGRFRIRLSSIEATEVTRELVDVMAASAPRVCPHLHLVLQSGSDRVLRRMGRRWGARRIVDRCRLVCERLDRPALSTDVIVGFPGETDADFADTLRAVEEIGYSQVHIFPFSPRAGTSAATMPNQISPAVKAQRIHELETLAARLRRRYHESLIGQQLEVLVEQSRRPEPGWAIGTACRFATVRIATPDVIVPGTLLNVRAEGHCGDAIWATPIVSSSSEQSVNAGRSES